MRLVTAVGAVARRLLRSTSAASPGVRPRSSRAFVGVALQTSINVSSMRGAGLVQLEES